MIKHIKKGIEARRQHEPIDRIELAKNYDRVAHELVGVRGTQRQVGEFIHVKGGTVEASEVNDPASFDPSRPTVLEDEIADIIRQTQSADRRARRILKIQRIAKALRLLEDHENGLVDLVYPGRKA